MKHVEIAVPGSRSSRWSAPRKAALQAGPSQAPAWRVGLILLVAALAIRFPWIGDMTYHEDESFYLVFAQAMHQGAIPYVDIWDRKPFGLFVLYWLITFLPANGMAAVQAASGLFAAGTAWAIFGIARRFQSERASLCSALAYLALTPTLLGAGGQSPMFYNAFIAAAALLILSMQLDSWPHREVRRYGALAMLCCGVALTMKPTTVVESLFLGLAAAWHVLFRMKAPLGWSVATIAGFMAMGALPTLLILGYFAAIGQLEAYWFATVVSIGFKTVQSTAITHRAVAYLALLAAPFWATCAAALAMLAVARPRPAATPFLTGWLLAALGGFLLVPNFWDHYTLPLLPPLLVLCAIVFARPGTGTLWCGLLLLWGLTVSGWPNNARARTANVQLAHVAETIDRERRGGCVYVYEGAPIIYAVTHGCHVTSRLFPQHLDFAREAPAIGVEPLAEIGRILARKPAIVVTSNKPLALPVNRQTRAAIYRGLHAGYDRIAALPLSESNKPPYKVQIWRLKGLAAQPRRARTTGR